jgi:hypothetical protein
MCDMDDVSFIEWFGWSTSLSKLVENGWQITLKPKYDNWRDFKNTKASSNYLYLRHPILKLIAKIKYQTGNAHLVSGHVEFLIPEKTRRIKPPKFIDQRDYCESDIEPMLEAIISIQKKRLKKRKELPSADVHCLMKSVF